MTYPEAIQFLYGLRLFGAKLGLETTLKLAALAGNPQPQLRFIHIAGTNGKGSTCAMLESIYRSAGLRVGLFTSPHLVSFRERIQVNRQLISPDEVVRLVQLTQGWLAEFEPLVHPTFFEVVTVMALRYFAEQKCDLVIWETGLGGRLDATNIVTPLASVITNVQLDHEKWLGSTVAQIAGEKAGIIKPGVPSLTAAEAPEALDVIRHTAARLHSPLTRVTAVDARTELLQSIQLPLLGEHQKLNAALAAATVRVLRPELPVSQAALRQGLEQVQWAGRLQLHRAADGRTFLLDGAHNPAGAETVRRALEQHFPGAKPALILGIMRDKDVAGICRALIPVVERVLLAPVQSERTASPDELQRLCLAIDPAIDVLPCSSLAEAFERARPARFVLVTGSLHFVGEALELLHLLPSSPNERELNEWDAAGFGKSGSAAQLR